MYYTVVVSRRRLSVSSTNCSIPICVFRTRNVYVLVVSRQRLSVGSTNCSIPFCVFFNKECLCISHFSPSFIGRFD